MEGCEERIDGRSGVSVVGGGRSVRRGFWKAKG